MPRSALLLGFALTASALFAAAPPAAAQAPQGLAASALADSSFTWARDSLPGIRLYFLRGSYAETHGDSLALRVPAAVEHARALIGAPPLPGPLDVFFIDSREQMMALTGARATGFAHTAARAVFLVTNPEWRAFERHEVMHVVAAQAWTPIGGTNLWLQEGLAQAAEGECAGYRNEAVAAALAAKHGWIELPTLLERFAEQSDLRAYLQSASLVAYLLDRAGASALRPLWQATVTPRSTVAGRTLASWEDEWRRQVPTGGVPDDALDAIEAVGCGIRPPGAPRR